MDQFIHVGHLLAMAALGVESGPDWQTEDRLRDPRVKEFIKKVKLEPYPKALELMYKVVKNEPRWYICPDRTSFPTATKVEIKAKRDVFRAYGEYVKGDYSNPITDEELKNKFAANSKRILTEEKIREATKTIFKLDKFSISEVIKSLIP